MFMTVLFAILISHCAMEFLPYLVPSAFLILVNFVLPFVMLLKLCKNKQAALNQPYMESSCLLSFIRENMLFSNPNATEDEIIDALKDANAWSFIEKKMGKTGLDTLVGGSAGMLSGG